MWIFSTPTLLISHKFSICNLLHFKRLIAFLLNSPSLTFFFRLHELCPMTSFTSKYISSYETMLCCLAFVLIYIFWLIFIHILKFISSVDALGSSFETIFQISMSYKTIAHTTEHHPQSSRCLFREGLPMGFTFAWLKFFYHFFLTPTAGLLLWKLWVFLIPKVRVSSKCFSCKSV